MKRPTTVALCFVLLLVGIILVSHSATTAHAQEEVVCVLPKAFGTLRGSFGEGVLFEAPDGTIRGVVQENNKCRVDLMIKRQ
jgi:hypothetical protein